MDDASVRPYGARPRLEKRGLQQWDPDPDYSIKKICDCPAWKNNMKINELRLIIR